MMNDWARTEKKRVRPEHRHTNSRSLSLAGADIYSVDIDSIYHFRRGQLLKTTETPESAVRKSDVIVCGALRLPNPFTFLLKY